MKTGEAGEDGAEEAVFWGKRVERMGFAGWILGSRSEKMGFGY